MVLTVLLVGFAHAGVVGVALLTFFGGFCWLDVAKENEKFGETGRTAAKFTGYAMIFGALCFGILALNGYSSPD